MMKKLKLTGTNKLVFWVCLLISISLIVGSFFVPPMGIIDGSVLAAVGELFGFASLGSLIYAVDKGHSAKIEKGDTTLTISNNDGEMTESTQI